MLSRVTRLLVSAIFLVVVGLATYGQTTTFTYQGKLTDSDANANGTYDFEFALYDAASNQIGPTLARAALTVTNGIFSVQLDFASSAFSGADRYLEVRARRNGDLAFTTLLPRQQITSAPYAIRSLSTANADTATTATSATSATTATNFTGSLAGDVSGTQNTTVVGKLQGRPVASTAPVSGQVLKYNGSQWGPGADNDTNTTYTAGNGLTLSGTTFSAAYGGDGSATTLSRSDHTHTGQAWTCSGTACKTLLLFTNDTDVNHAALYGQVNSATAEGAAVWGTTNSANANSAGVYAAAQTGSSKGLWAQASGTSGIAVYGLGTNGSKAAQFDGNVTVNGTLSKAAGSFKIDDPIDPDNKYLYHSFVESPDMMNIYNGNIITDRAGNATVTMPNWFEALNRDFRYQLTVIGQFAQAVVAEEIAGNQFKIKTDKPNVKVSWQVTGIRHDKFADENRIPVEENKASADKGKCLYAAACQNR